MVGKIIRANQLERWRKNQFKKAGVSEVHPGFWHMFVYEPDSQSGSIWESAPIVAPVQFTEDNSGFWGLNILMLPSIGIRAQALNVYNQMKNIRDPRTRAARGGEIKLAFQKHSLMNGALKFYKYNRIKSKIVLVSEGDLRTHVIRRI